VLLLFTDGLTDSIAAKNPQECLRDVLADSSNSKMASLKSLLDPKLNDDDVPILLVGRPARSNPGSPQRENRRVGPTAV
jgi:serine/threonine protein phosphatase PrpC